MKKFNSTLAIAAIALTSVLGFTSCDKSDDPISQVPTPQVQQTNTQQEQNEVVHKTYIAVQSKAGNQAPGTSWTFTDQQGKEYVLTIKEKVDNVYTRAELTVDGQTFVGLYSCAASFYTPNLKNGQGAFAYVIDASLYGENNTEESFRVDIEHYGEDVAQGVTFNRAINSCKRRLASSEDIAQGETFNRTPLTTSAEL